MIFLRFLIIMGYAAVAVALVGGLSVIVAPSSALFPFFTFFVGVGIGFPTLKAWEDTR